MFTLDLEQQTLRLAIEKLNEALELGRDVSARCGRAWPLEKQLEVSVTVAKLRALVLR